MNVIRIAAVLLIVAGVFGLVYSNSGYTTETNEAKLELLKLSSQVEQEVDISFWAGVIALEIGSALLLLGYKKD